MNVLIAPNSIKNAANASVLADAIAIGIRTACPDSTIQKLPLADGGEYTLEIILNELGGETIELESLDPLGRQIQSIYGITTDNTAIIELPKASGFELLSAKEKNPLHTSTFGTGIQIRDALKRGCNNIMLTLGGSATVDGGSGILEALGVKFLDSNDNQLPKGGGNLIILDKFDDSGLMKEAKEATFTILSDVQNVLLGENGAAMVFAPQKGAGPLETMVLERCMANFGSKCEEFSGKKLINMKGAGAAGGVAVGLKAFFNTKIISASEYILDILKADEKIAWADVVITAEGKLDSQTFSGKAPAILAKRVKTAGKKIICIAGQVPLRSEAPDELFDAVFSIQNRPMSLEESIENTLENIKNTAFEIGRLL
jgi:glycerate kinase